MLEQGSNAIAYTRISSKTQNTGTSLQMQLNSILFTANAAKVNIVKIFQVVKSGFNSNNLTELSEEITKWNKSSSTKIKYILVHSFERFSRNLLNAEEFLQQHPNVLIYSVLDQCLSNSATGRRMFRAGIMSGQFESDKLSEKMRASYQYRVAAGKYKKPAGTQFGLREQTIGNFITYLKKQKNYPLQPEQISHHLSAIGLPDVPLSLPDREQTRQQNCALSESVIQAVKELGITNPNDLAIIKKIAERTNVPLTDSKSDDSDDSDDDSCLPSDGTITIDQMNSFDKIAKFLNFHGIYNHGKPWTKYTIKKVGNLNINATAQMS